MFPFVNDDPPWGHAHDAIPPEYPYVAADELKVPWPAIAKVVKYDCPGSLATAT